MISELRLLRVTNALCDLHLKLPFGARVIRVRYTSTELVCIFQ